MVNAFPTNRFVTWQTIVETSQMRQIAPIIFNARAPVTTFLCPVFVMANQTVKTSQMSVTKGAI